MGSKPVNLDDEAYAYLNELKQSLPKRNGRDASFSDAVKYHKKLNQDICTVILKHFENLNKTLLIYYSGNSDKAHISNQLKTILLIALDSDKNYKKISKKLNEIMEGK